VASAANVIKEASATDASSYTTTAQAGASGKGYVITVINSKTTTPETVTLVHSGGLNPVEILSVVGTGSNRRMTVFRALKTSGVSAGTFTADAGGVTQTGWIVIVDEVTDPDTSGTDGSAMVVQSASNDGSSTTASVTLASFGDPTNNLAWMSVMLNSNVAITEESGYTELADLGHGGPTRRGFSEYKVGEDTQPTATFTSSPWNAIGLELKAAAGGTPFTITPSGAITPAGSLVRATDKRLGGATTPAGSIVKAVASFLAGGSSPTGSLRKDVSKPIAGSISPTGALDLLRFFALAVGGSISPGGTLRRDSSKLLAGALTPAGSVRKDVSKTFAGAITPAGPLALLRFFAIALAGAIAPSGTLRRDVGKLLTGATAPGGSLRREIAKQLAGTAAPAGSLAKSIAKRFSGSVAPVGALATQVSAVVQLGRLWAVFARRVVAASVARRLRARGEARRARSEAADTRLL